MALEESVVADLLIQKYSLLKREIWLHIGYYKAHVRNVQLAGTALAAGAAYLISQGNALLPNTSNWWFWWALTILIPIIINYLVLDIVEAHYAAILLGERLATIETDLNSLAGRRLFIWETSGAPAFYQSFRPVKGVINPEWFLGVLGAIMIFFSSVLVPGVLLWLLWTATPTTNTPLRLIAIIASSSLSVGTTSLGYYAGAKTLLRLRGVPRQRFRQMLDVPLSRDVAQQSVPGDAPASRERP